MGLVVRALKLTFVSIVILAAILRAQDASWLTRARALDQEILKAKDLPDDIRPRVIRSLALRVRQQTISVLEALAFNLAASTFEADGRVTLQDVATTLADALRRSPVQNKTDEVYLALAELDRYGHASISLEDQRYIAALAQLEANDQHRSESDFTLTDMQGRIWNLKSLRGKVVLVNFWATWCPPCRREIPDLEELYGRFQGQGLIVLAISGEEASTIKDFLFRQKASYPMLLDPGQKVKELFRVRGIPKSFVFDRKGNLIGETIDRPAMSGWLELLERAGLR